MKSINQIDFSEKKAFVRVDFNVPFDDAGRISDNSRITAALPTIKYILSCGGSYILASHLGRPKGKTKDLSLSKLVPELEKLLSTKVLFCDDCIGEKTESQCSNLKPGEVILLENLRFYKEETDADESFAKKLSNLADIYVNDAFGTCHREHTSINMLPRLMKESCAGLLIEEEISNINKILNDYNKPFTAILGGAKVSDKIKVIEKFIELADNIIIGGAMSNTFIKALGGNIGNSLYEENKLSLALDIIDKAEKNNVKLVLPVDSKCSKSLGDQENILIFESNKIENKFSSFDIGPKSLKTFSKIIKNSKSF